MRPQRGIALISAMLIAALVTAGAVALATNQYFGTRRVSNVLRADRAQLVIVEIEALASAALRRDSELGKYDATNEPWATAEFSVTQSDISASGKLRDLQGRFNLTNLSSEPQFQGADGVDPAAPPAPDASTPSAVVPTEAPVLSTCVDGEDCAEEPIPSVSTPQAAEGPKPGAAPTAEEATQVNTGEQQLRLLFKALALDATPIQAILDWIDPDTETRFPNGAEDDYYTEQGTSYRAANRPLATPRELLLIKGVTLEAYKKIAPFVVCLPRASKVNINTARKEVLMSLAPGFDSSAAEIILRARETQPFTDPAMFLQHPLLQFRKLPADSVATVSEFFELSSVASNDHFDIAVDSVLKRNGKEVALLARKRHNFDE